MSKHTPAPWRFDNDWHRLPTIFGANGAKVAIIEKTGGGRQGSSAHTPAQEADARLIEAAPDMFGLLDEIASSIKGGESGKEILSSYGARIITIVRNVEGL